jgi:hypothetical protein
MVEFVDKKSVELSIRIVMVHNGVLSEEEIQKKLSVTYCPR